MAHNKSLPLKNFTGKNSIPVIDRVRIYAMVIKNIPAAIISKLPLPINREIRRYYCKLLKPGTYREYQKLRTAINQYNKTLIAYEAYNCIFVRIPKCATQAISMSLFGNKGGGHIDISTYQIIFSIKEFNSFFKFTFVRNPWDRLVSAYFFLMNGGAIAADKAWRDAYINHLKDFNSFVSNWVNKKNVYTEIHFKPQHEFILGKNGKLLVDYVGYYEHLEDDYRHIADRLSISRSLSHINRSETKNKDYRQYYSDKSAETVAAIYQRDIELLGYKFDDPRNIRRII